MKETLTVEEVAKRLGVGNQTIRIGLQRGIFTFGYAVRNSTGRGWRYIIPTEKFNQFMGVLSNAEVVRNVSNSNSNAD